MSAEALECATMRPLSPRQREALALVADGNFYPCLVKEDDGWHARWRALGVAGEAGAYVDSWVDEYVRAFTMTRLSEDAEDQRHETLHDAWILALRSRTGLVRWDDAECAAFAAELESWSGNAQEDRAARRNVVVRLCPPESDARPFVVSCTLPKGRRSLRALGQAAYIWSPLCGLKTSREGRVVSSLCLGMEISRAEADDFIRRGARELGDAGYTVEGVVPVAPLVASAEIATDEPRAVSAPALKLTVRVAGSPVTAEEIRFLLDQGSTLVYFRDRWIEVDRGILKEALRALEKGAGKKVQALSFALGLGHVGKLELEEVKAHGWLRGLVNELRNSKDRKAARGAEAVGKPAGFMGELRDYQKRGVEWLSFLTKHGFGALLADDMGLGKTIQVIAWILQTLARPSRLIKPSVLVVAPLTLLSNWRHELAKFAPGLAVYVHQGGDRHVESGFARAVAGADVTLTSYNLLVKDHAAFAGIRWDALVVDEAQAIKNPDTQAARAIRALTPPRRIAITGTPVENSVGDLWSLEEFLNPGLLGERKSFVERFVKPIAADGQGTAGKRLRHALEPFILRRLKSDGKIAAELGEKREIREYCELAPEQRRDYETALADFRASDHVRRAPPGRRVRAADAAQADLRRRGQARTALRTACDDLRERRVGACLHAVRQGRRLAAHGTGGAVRQAVSVSARCALGRRAGGGDPAIPGIVASGAFHPFAEGGRFWAEPHEGDARHPLRPVVESGGREPGDGPRAPHRAEKDGVCPSFHQHGHVGGTRGRHPRAQGAHRRFGDHGGRMAGGGEAR